MQMMEQRIGGDERCSFCKTPVQRTISSAPRAAAPAYSCPSCASPSTPSGGCARTARPTSTRCRRLRPRLTRTRGTGGARLAAGAALTFTRSFHPDDPHERRSSWSSPTASPVVSSERSSRFERRGFVLRGMKALRIDHALAERHYAEHIGKPFFESLASSSPPAPWWPWCGKGARPSPSLAP